MPAIVSASLCNFLYNGNFYIGICYRSVTRSEFTDVLGILVNLIAVLERFCICVCCRACVDLTAYNFNNVSVCCKVSAYNEVAVDLCVACDIAIACNSYIAINLCAVQCKIAVTVDITAVRIESRIGSGHTSCPPVQCRRTLIRADVIICTRIH